MNLAPLVRGMELETNEIEFLGYEPLVQDIKEIIALVKRCLVFLIFYMIACFNYIICSIRIR